MVQEPVPSPLTKSPPCIIKSLILKAVLDQLSAPIRRAVDVLLGETCYSCILVAFLGSFCFHLCRICENFRLSEE
jgi:hypothetical protein